VRVESYRGFVFGSLNHDVLPLEDHLGEAKVIIDQMVDQAPEGLEVLTGNSTYTFDGNWGRLREGAESYAKLAR
jgi:benzoate/toluate 1,2-dioxygenase alpha subunit